MVGDEGAVHPANFNLHHVLEEPTPNKIEVLPLEALELAPLLVDIVVQVVQIVGHIVANRRAGPRFDLENIGLVVLVVAQTVDLRPQHDLVVGLHIPIVVLGLGDWLLPQQGLGLLLGVGEEVLYHVAQVHQHLVVGGHDTLVRNDGLHALMHFLQEEGGGLPEGAHPA